MAECGIGNTIGWAFCISLIIVIVWCILNYFVRHSYRIVFAKGAYQVQYKSLFFGKWCYEKYACGGDCYGGHLYNFETVEKAQNWIKEQKLGNKP